MTEAAGFLPPTWETWVESPVSAPTAVNRHLGNWTGEGGLSLFLCLSKEEKLRQYKVQ